MPWEKQFDVQQVLDRAMGAFWSRGYAATSMQDLVDCTGVNRASLYATYGDKRALFMAALERYETEYCQRQLADLEAAYGPREAITQLFELFLARRTGPDQRGCFMTNTALELAAHDAEIGGIVARTQNKFEDFFRRMIERGKAIGEIPQRVPTETAARSLLSTLLGLAVLACSREEPGLLASVKDEALGRLG